MSRFKVGDIIQYKDKGPGYIFKVVQIGADGGSYKIDYVKDGYDLDTVRFPKKEKDLHIFDIDEQISKDAAEGICKEAPDLSWVYLWYTDDAGHIAGNGAFFDE